MTTLLAAAYLWSQVLVPGKTAVQQFGINDRGQTVVTTDDGSNGIYDHGKFKPLPPPPASCGCTVTGLAVSDRGVVAGIASPIGGGPEQGFTLTETTYTFFSWPGWDNTEPRGIGSQGLVVGWAFSNDYSQSAGFLYDPATGAFTNLTPGSGYPTIVQGINRFGRVAGNFVQTAPRKLFGLVAQPDAGSAFGATQLPFANRFQLGGAFTWARGINDYGILTGWTRTAAGGYASFVGSDSWGYEAVVPPGADAADRSVFCTGINNMGQVACSVDDLGLTTTYGLYIGTPTSPQEH